MRQSLKAILVAMSAFTVVACSGAAEEEPRQDAGAEEPVIAEAASDGAPAESVEAFEVCDEGGNRYPSEADAEAAGLDRAEYGATFCEYAD